MNLLRKLYCRTFQTCFRLALPVLPYRTPEVLSSVSDIPSLLREKGITSVLLVTDSSIRKLGLTARLESGITGSGIKLAVFDSTVANPTTDNVEDARRMYIQNGCQALIGFGGGSSIDAAKAVGARIAYPKKPLSAMKGILKVRRRIPLLIAVPTTAGTGSETTLATVIVESGSRHKYAINSFPLIPRYAVLDPEVTRSLPSSITATTGIDALTHAVEAFIGRSTSKDTREASLEAVSLIFANLPSAVRNGNDMEARANMLRASFLAGKAFTKSYVGYVHAVAHTLGGKYNTPHGLANAVLLPYVLKSYGRSAEKKLALLAEAIGITEGSGKRKAAAFISRIEALEKEIGIPETLSGIKEEDIPALAKIAEKEANPLYPVPRLMEAKELEVFYHDAMEKKTVRTASA